MRQIMKYESNEPRHGEDPESYRIPVPVQHSAFHAPVVIWVLGRHVQAGQMTAIP